MFGTILNFGRTATHKAEIRFVTSDIGELCDMKIPQNPKHPSDKKNIKFRRSANVFAPAIYNDTCFSKAAATMRGHTRTALSD